MQLLDTSNHDAIQRTDIAGVALRARALGNVWISLIVSLVVSVLVLLVVQVRMLPLSASTTTGTAIL